MPSNARWRCLKIVEAQIPKVAEAQTPNKEGAIVSGLKNALERGETIEKAKQSFINAGYKPEEVAAAAQKVPVTTSKITTPVTTEKTTTPDKAKATSSQTPSATPGQKKQISKKFTIILISLASLVVIGIVLIGIFWSKIFG